MKLILESNAEQPLALGGQALIEGVMMRTGSHMVMCVRQPDNDIVTHIVEINSLVRRNRILGLPFIRGIILLFETMYYGVKGIFYSANIALEEEDEEFTWKEYLLVLIAVLMMSSFFVVVPVFLANIFNLTGVISNIFESLFRLSLFILYLYMISLWGEFKRILQYHGAEHKAINAFEAGAPLDVKSVSSHSRLNPRCGTSFLFIVVIMSLVFFSLLPELNFYMKITYRMLLIPVIGAFSYELLKLSDKYRESRVMNFFITPGLLFQRLTTKEPDNDIIEVAVEALGKLIEV